MYKTCSHKTDSEAPQELQLLGGFDFRLSLSALSVQPFADAVANYTCCDGKKKGDYVFLHALTSSAVED